MTNVFFRALLTDNGGSGGGDFQAHEAVVGVEVENDLQIGGHDFEAFVGFSFGADRASPIDGDGIRQELLRHENREGLRASAIPIINASQDSVLVVEVVVEDDDEWGIKGEVLLERVGAADLDGHFSDAIGKEDVGATGFIGLRGPFVGDGGTVGLEGKIAGNGSGRSTLRRKVRSGFGRPDRTAGSNLELFVTDGFAVEKNLELALIGCEDGACRRFFLGCVSEETAGNSETEKNRDTSNESSS